MGLAVSVVIPAYNAEAVIGRCLEACLAQEYDGALEIVVVDDGSTDRTAGIVARYPVLYVRQENSGPATARNTGAQASTGALICFTDSDCAPERRWVAKLAAEFADATVGAAGGSYNIGNPESLLARCIHEEIVQRHILMPREVNYLGGFNVCYRRKAFERAGGFDESFHMASAEDNDLSYRVRKSGYTLRFNSDARVSHLHPTRLGCYLRTQFWHGYWSMKLYRRHPDMARGDAYSDALDHLEPLLSLVILAGLPFVFWWPVAAGLVALLVVLALLQLRRPVQIVQRTHDARLLALAAVTFARGFARAPGMVYGIGYFWLWGR